MSPAVPQPGDARVRFTYDYMGRRVRKLTELFCEFAGGHCEEALLGLPDGSGVFAANLSPSEDIRFIYDGWNVVMERTCEPDCVAEVVRNKYAWATDLARLNRGRRP